MAAEFAINRIMREVQNIKKYYTNIVDIDFCDRITELKSEILGPPETPYEGGKFTLEIILPYNYPFVPPDVRFITQIWHPNVSSLNGVICKDNWQKDWCAGLNICTVLFNIQLLLENPDPNCINDPIVNDQYIRNYSMFCKTAKHWTNVYAGGPHTFPDYDDNVQTLCKKGFDEAAVRLALSKNFWNIGLATSALQKA